MDKEKMDIIEQSANEYKKLPVDKKMFILGYMHGVVMREAENTEKKGVRLING